MKKLKKRYGCATELTLDLVGGKWRTLILAWLKEEPQRFSDLQRRIPGISDKMLTQCLQELQATGLIGRSDNGYVLTPAGEGLRPALEALHAWGTAAASERGVELDN